jgi:Skp family chaperone for outer membrane proteins
MTAKLGWVVALALAAAAGVKGYSQDKASPPAAKIALVDLRLCLDPAHNERARDVEAELKKVRDGMAKRMQQADSQTRERLRADYLDLRARRKHATCIEAMRVAEVVAKERGYTMVLRGEPVPIYEEIYEDTDSLDKIITHRPVIWHDGGSDLSEEVIKRLNEAYDGEKKKKDF